MNSYIRKTWLIISALIFGGLLALSYTNPTWSLLALAVIVFWLIFWWKNEIGLYVLILALPLIHWDFFVGPLVIPFIDLVGVLVLSGFVLQSFYQLLTTGRSGWRAPLVKKFLLFFGLAILSSLLSNYIEFSVWYAVRWILFFYLAYICLPYNIIKSERILKRSLIVLVISAVAVSLVGLLSLWGQDWQEAFFRIEPMAVGGVFIFGDNHNLIAEFLVMAAFFALALKHWAKAKTKVGLNWLFIFLAIIAIGTFSRSAWIILAIQGFVFLNYTQHSFIRKHFILITLILIIVSTPITLHMLNLQKENTSSTENRWHLTEIALENLQDKPLLGQGTGSFFGLVTDDVRFRAKYGDPLDSHGVWQKVLAENGLLGTLAFLIFVLTIFIRMFRAVNKYVMERDLLLPLVAGSLGAFLFQFFNTSYYKGKVWLPIAITLAAIEVIKYKHGKKSKKN